MADESPASRAPQAEAPADPKWWGAHSFALGQTRCLRVGPLFLELTRRENEWSVSYGYDVHELSDTFGVDSHAAPVRSLLESRRFALETSAEISLVPWLVEQPTVVRPIHRLTLPQGADISLYFSTAVNVVARDGSATGTARRRGQGALLTEFPTVRPKETFFGPSTMEGEVCFVSRTLAKLSLDELPFRPNRAITEVRLANRGKEPVDIARFRVPMPYLSLYWSEETARFLTEPVSFTADGDGLGALAVGKPPAGATRISGPREELKVPITQALSRLWA